MSNNTITLSDAEYDFLINEAREAGRREGLEGFAQRAEGFTSPWYSPEEIAAIVRIYVKDMQRRALIDSPKAEVEEPK